MAKNKEKNKEKVIDVENKEVTIEKQAELIDAEENKEENLIDTEEKQEKVDWIVIFVVIDIVR